MPTHPARRSPLRRLVVAVVVPGLLLVGVPAAVGSVRAAYGAGTATPTRAVAPPELAGREGELVAAAGDLACAPVNRDLRAGFGTAAGCQSQQVAALLDGQRLDAFLPLGDEQYQTGALTEFEQVYDRHFGRFKAITRPVPGNHEYQTPDGSGYYSYFGAAAHQENPYGARAAGTYSYDVGSWHLVALNSMMCTPISPCTPDAPIMRWLAADLAAHPNRCTLAYWHHPIWSVGEHGSYGPMVPVWNALYDAGADLVLASHDHNYQRYAPIGRASLADPASWTPAAPVVDRERGMPLFIVGTGGANNYGFDPAPDPGVAAALEAGSSNPATATFGVLFLRLGDGSFSWRFAQAASPQTLPFEDAGSAPCH